MDGYLIGELAQRSGMSRRALRLYEARGILPAPRRTASGYRVYPRESLELLSFIAGGRRLGLTLAEIRHIAMLRREGSRPCLHVRSLLEDKALELEGLLAQIRSVLKAWDRAAGSRSAVCPHIELRGGEVRWKRSRSAHPATTARRL
jgi:DNA-binding transcriptional MerR regulator